MGRINVHAILHGTRANGPGVRTCVWTQGCSVRCRGCWNPDTWDPEGPSEGWDPEELAEAVVRDALPGTEGISLSGGEPTDQDGAAAAFVRAVLLRRPRWTVLMWTGRTSDALRRTGRTALLSVSDVAVCGPYRADEADPSLRWRGSRNQTVEVLTGRIEAPEDRPEAEFVFTPDGRFVLTGIPMEIKEAA